MDTTTTRFVLALVSLCALALAQCSPGDPPTPATQDSYDGEGDPPLETPPPEPAVPEPPAALPGDGELPVVHVTFFSHNEEDTARYGGYDQRETWKPFRDALLEMARLVNKYDGRWNFQTDWRFLEGNRAHETAEDRAETGDKTLLRHMTEDLGIQVDPHSHECSDRELACDYNYADVAQMVHRQSGRAPDLVGGFINYPVEHENWSRFAAPVSGVVFPDYAWQPRIIWGGSSANHSAGDEVGSGIWRPASAEAFTTDDPGGALINVGIGTHLSNHSQDMEQVDQYKRLLPVKKLIDAIAEGTAPADGFYTASFSVFELELVQGDVTFPELEAYFKQLATWRDEGKIRWVTYQEAVQLWEQDHGARASYFNICQHERCTGKLQRW